MIFPKSCTLLIFTELSNFFNLLNNANDCALQDVSILLPFLNYSIILFNTSLASIASSLFNLPCLDNNAKITIESSVSIYFK